MAATPNGAPAPKEPERGEIASGWLTDRPFSTDYRQKRFGGAVGTSMVLHLAGLLIFIAFIRSAPGMSAAIQENLQNVTYVFTPGPGGGGGGGGNKSPDPPKRAELATPEPPKTATTAPVPKPVVETPPTIPPPITTQAPANVPGTLTALSGPPTPSQGSGTGGGGGTGTGTGTGAGSGSGVGEGSGGGTGGGVYQPGSLVTNPTVISEKRPVYTAEAMRAKIQGIVVIEGVVLPNGSFQFNRITQSLDKIHGLDQKAVEAVKLWRFAPGRLKATGEAVPVLVTVELTFTLR